LLAGVALLPFLVAERLGGRHERGDGNPPGDPAPSGKPRLLAARNIVGFFMIGILGLLPASAFLAWGIDRSSASNAALIYLTVPIITAVMASMILDERMTLVRWASLAVALAGVLILSNFDWRHLGLTSNQYLIGNILVLLACATSAFYNVYCKELLRRFTPLEVLVYGYFLAVILCLPLSVWLEGFSPASIRNYHLATWVALLALSGLSWGLAMVLWMFLLKRLDVSQASVSVYLLPFLGVLVSAVTVHDQITSRMLAGGLVTLVGTVLVTTTEPTVI
jgi:drug/metabolite transporter (DMT)-like permease